MNPDAIDSAASEAGRYGRRDFAGHAALSDLVLDLVSVEEDLAHGSPPVERARPRCAPASGGYHTNLTAPNDAVHNRVSIVRIL